MVNSQNLLFFSSGLLIGAGVSYFVTKSILEQRIQMEIDEEIAKIYQDLEDRREKKGDYATAESARIHTENIQRSVEMDRELAQQRDELVHDLGYDSTSDAEEEFLRIQERRKNEADTAQDAIRKKIEREAKNPYHIFDPNNKKELEGDSQDPRTWDRSSDYPYVIAEEEYMEEFGTHHKLTVVYYEYDNQMVDEREQLVADIDEFIGDKNLLHFGKGSSSPDTLYIRNETKEFDVEIVRDERSYTEVVLGEKPDHDDHPPKVKKMRGDDR